MKIIKKIFKIFFFKITKDYNKKTLPKIVEENKLFEARKILTSQLYFKFVDDKKISNILKNYKIEYNLYFNSLIRTKLAFRYLFYQILNCFYLNKKKIYFPYPKELKRNILYDKSSFLNNVFWYFYIFFDFGRILYLKIFFTYLNEKNKIKNVVNFEKQIIFIHLGDIANFSATKFIKWLDLTERNYYPIFVNNLQKSNIYNSDYSIINNHNYIFLYHLNIKNFIKIYITDLFTTLFELIIFFNWKKVLIYNDLIDLKIFKLIKKKMSHKHLFLYTQNLHKPLWTFEANKIGIKTTLIFNGSTSEMGTSGIQKANEDWKGVKFSYWDDFLYWNDYHKKFLENFFPSKSKVFNKGKYLIISGEKKIEVPNKTIVLFPHDFNTSYYGFENIMEYYYYNKNTYYDFFEKIIKVCTNLNINIFIKLKKVNSWSRSEHLKYVNEISKKYNVFLCDHDADVEDLIRKSIGTLSMPSSSTSVISEEIGIKTAIIDFTKFVDKNDDCLHGLKKIDNKNELRIFLENL